jgi:hypothetical protein
MTPKEFTVASGVISNGNFYAIIFTVADIVQQESLKEGSGLIVQ